MLILTACFTPKGDIEEGKRWYVMHNCYACHGNNGNDGRAAEITGIDMGFSSFVRFLRNPDSPSMPPFSESKLPKDDAADIYAWLRSLPK
jgi:mono/diheme cytochrome c family protein